MVLCVSILGDSGDSWIEQAPAAISALRSQALLALMDGGIGTVQVLGRGRGQGCGQWAV